MIRDHLGLPAGRIFDALAESKYTFYLTGSRYMGGARKDSDWDFLTANNAGVYGFLAELGFKPHLEQDRYAFDNRPYCLTAEVLQVEDGEHKVQVQLSRDVQLQRAVRDIIQKYAFERHLTADRDMRSRMWDGIARGLLGERCGA